MWPSKDTSLAAVWAIPMAPSIIASGFTSSPHSCPVLCDRDSSNWTPYASVERLEMCDQPMLLDIPLHVPLRSPEATAKVSACRVESEPNSFTLDLESTERLHFASREHTSVGRDTEDMLDWIIEYDGSSDTRILDPILGYVQAYLKSSNLATARLFWYLNGVVVGIHSGAAISNAVTASSIIGEFRDRVARSPGFKSAVLQLCSDDRNADDTFGIAVDTSGNIAAVQDTMSLWDKSLCVRHGAHSVQPRDALVITSPYSNPYHGMQYSHEVLLKRSNCTAETVVFGDSCASLAEKCAISEDEFMEFNTEDGLCSSLVPGQEVCCSGASPSPTKPIMDDDGFCASYTTKANDTCLSIAADYGLDESDISFFNDETTWGWSGCDDLRPGLKICLSDGQPPMPASVSDAVCGPTVLGTKYPADGTPLGELNPCPLNACCDVRGRCGITPEYCTYEDGPTGNPGTAPAGHNGCISNCGVSVTNNFDAPAHFMRIGYYESWSWDRPCLNLRVSSINSSEYTHIHWGFADIDSKFKITVNDTYNQWKEFVALEDVRRIISFGGWGYSINSASYDVLRAAMDPKNVDIFIQNILDFVEDNELDGVDFDWEYPRASDVPTVHSGLKSDGPNYLGFLEKLSELFPVHKSISIAAPACFWYLKRFPIESMSHHLDYIVYMTYDLHGQWDYNNQLSQDLYCKTGNCLRSHVNLTETEYALAMITKAGVPSSMITVGVPSYGRSFGMSEAGCSGPQCTFEGPESTAQPGLCTGTAGLLANAEIEEVINDGLVTEHFYDERSDSDIVVYNETQWVSYLNRTTKRRRIEHYKSLNFSGYADWAVDLADWTGDDGNPEGTSD